MRISVIGAGYVGLANAVLLAQKHAVTIYDLDQKKLDLIEKRVSPITDKEITEYLSKKSLVLQVERGEAAAYADADVVLIATPTNYDPEKNYFDTTSVEQSIALVCRYSPAATVVIKSTVPVGFTTSIALQYPDMTILFSPEFLREGRALYDNLHPSRIIVGAMNAHKDIASTVGNLFCEASLDSDVPVLIMEPTEAEAVKLFSNTYLALRISYFNELDTYAELHGLDTASIIRGVGLDPRIGTHYNNPSFGYGGYCLPKDTKQLLANYANVPENMIEAIVRSNDTRKEHIATRALELARKAALDPTIGIYRLTMKTGSDNYRESSVQGVMERLQKANVKVVVYEPTFQGNSFLGCPIIHDFDLFKDSCDLILANRYDNALEDVNEKVYSRDLFARD